MPKNAGPLQICNQLSGYLVDKVISTVAAVAVLYFAIT